MTDLTQNQTPKTKAYMYGYHPFFLPSYGLDRTFVCLLLLARRWLVSPLASFSFAREKAREPLACFAFFRVSVFGE